MSASNGRTLGDVASRFLTAAAQNAVLPQAGIRTNLRFVDSLELSRMSTERSWLVRGAFETRLPAIVGGPRKSLKTSIMIDLAVSLASGRPFLGRFSTSAPHNIGLVSGESGPQVVRTTFSRVCEAKEIDNPASLPIEWCFAIPRVGNPEELAWLHQVIRDRGMEVVIIDPLYLSLLAGNSAVDASNLFQMGPLLSEVASACLEAGATPVLVHHFTKTAGRSRRAPELDDLAYAGFQEFASFICSRAAGPVSMSADSAPTTTPPATSPSGVCTATTLSAVPAPTLR